MSAPQVSLIITVLNEAKNMAHLLVSIKHQTLLPTEVIIVDGGSADLTQKIIQDFSQKNPQLKVLVISKPGNRSLGRNTAIKLAKSSLIAITDAGCVLEPDWLAELVKSHQISGADVVAGYYRGLAKTDFQTALIPYVLVMPDKLPKTKAEIFLPATRSMLISKTAWKKAGEFDENLSDNEDYALAQALVKTGPKLAFCKTAIVNWQPPNNLATAIKMFYRFAKGDAQAKIWRPKVGLIFGRYFLGLLAVVFLMRTNWLESFLVLSLISYSLWAIKKNLKYARKAWLWLPILQITSDFAIMIGSTVGWLKSLNQ